MSSPLGCVAGQLVPDVFEASNKCLKLEMMALWSVKILGITQPTQHRAPQGPDLQQNHCDLKSYIT